MLAFVSRYVGPADRKALADAKLGLAYTDYDWTLNEQTKP